MTFWRSFLYSPNLHLLSLQPQPCLPFRMRFRPPKDYCLHYQLSSDEQLQIMIKRYGPTVVAVDANLQKLQHLRGPLDEPKCSEKVNHVLLAVGWTKKYWILKNSWGTNWGVKGYMYLARGKGGNACGIRTLAGVPLMTVPDDFQCKRV